jgi:hypothetical protein
VPILSIALFCIQEKKNSTPYRATFIKCKPLFILLLQRFIRVSSARDTEALIERRPEKGAIAVVRDERAHRRKIAQNTASIPSLGARAGNKGEKNTKESG